MAESSRQSSSRKRPAELDDSADQSPIVQLSHAQLCGCNVCWQRIPVRPSFRHSARLRAKKLKQAKRPAALDHEREAPKNFFVYEGYELTDHLCWSADGRYMFVFTGQSYLLVVDSRRNAYKLWNAPTKWLRGSYVKGILAVSCGAILLSTSNIHGSDGTSVLHLLRVPDIETAVYERVLLHSNPGDDTAFILTEITGEEVDLKRAVLGRYGEIVFLTLDIDEPRVTVQHTNTHPELPAFAGRMSEDGSRLYTLSCRFPKELHVYALDEQKWTKETLDGGEFNVSRCNCFPRISQALFVRDTQEVDGIPTSLLHRYNFEAKQWEEIAFVPQPAAHLFPIFDPADGDVDGAVVVERMDKEQNGHRVSRFKIERVMFRNPDSLRNLCVTAAHKSREEIDGKCGFQHEMNKPPLKSVLPSVFPGMKPIPVRRHE